MDTTASLKATIMILQRDNQNLLHYLKEYQDSWKLHTEQTHVGPAIKLRCFAEGDLYQKVKRYLLEDYNKE